MVGTGKGAQRGILIKSGEALEQAHHIDTVVLDKTGTITEGKPQMVDIIPLTVDKEELLAMTMALEKASQHPWPRQLLTMAKRQMYLSTKLLILSVKWSRNFRSSTGTKSICRKCCLYGDLGMTL